jgi:hypothetical protein
LVTGAVVLALVAVQPAKAIDSFWQGDVSSNYGGVAAAAGNWSALGGGGTLTSPRAGEGERAVIGTDDPAGALNSELAPFGSPVISSAVAVPGGIALGLRVIDYEDLNFNTLTSDFLYDNFGPDGNGNNTVVIAPFFDTSTLVGKLTIATGGNVAPITTSVAAFGADGRVLVGVHGRGYLTMTGGTLTAPALVVGGPNITTDAGTPQELGPSTVDLSGNASLQITGGATGIANLDRRTKVTGPDVNFNATGRIRFTSASLLTAAITSATAHSPLKTSNNALLSGAVAVEFSGAAATRDPIASLGQTWNLIDSSLSTNAIDGNFTNLGPGGLITPTGLDAAHAAPLGANYRVKKAVGTGPLAGHSLLQLSYEQTLVLTVNRDTGNITIRNPLSGNIAIDAYSINSARGSMVASYAGLGSSTPGAGVWVKDVGQGLNTINALSEVQDPTTDPAPYNLSAVSSVSLGTGFSRTGVGANIANYGFDGEDLVFEYGGPATGDIPLRGQVEYVGTKFENDFVLRVNPNSGQAFIKNDSLVTLKFDGYSVLSSTGNLIGPTFSGGLGGTWQTSSPPTTNAISQSNLTSFTTLAPGAELAIGDISSLNFTTPEAQAGLSIQYILSEGLTNVNPAGDYNNDGTVNAADYTTWRNNLGATISLTNQSPLAITRSLVDQEDYELWKANFGAVAGLVPDTTFRTGSVVFDATPGAGGGGLAGAAVPEPAAGLLMLVGLGAVGMVRRSNRHRRTDCDGVLKANGATTMSNRNCMLIAVLAGIAAVMVAAAPVSATTQAIPLTNGDFTLPGPLGSKVVAFGEDGTPFAPTDPVITLSSGQDAGGIPGWTFTGGTNIPGNGETPGKGAANPPDLGDQLPGDSGTEGVGGGLADNEMILSTFDGKAFQTSSFNVQSITANQKYQIAFDAHNIFTRGTTIDMIGPMAQLTARVYYVDGSSVKQTLATRVLNDVEGEQRPLIEFHGNVPAEMALLTPAMGRPIGIEFDTTSFESDPTRVTDSWIGIDNVIMQITGLKRGDFDGDGDVDVTDYATLRNNMNEAHTYEFEGELTNDYVVDLNDFRLFKTLYEAANPGAGGLEALGVPEPSSLLLLLLGTAGVVGSTLRKRFVVPGRVRLFLLAAIGLAVSLAHVAPASATLLFYDPFATGGNPALGQYNSFTPNPPSTPPDPPVAPVTAQNPLVRIRGQNPTVGPTPLFAGAWTDVAGNTPTQYVQTTSLVYRGAPSIGGSVTTVFDNVNNPTLSSGEGRVGRVMGTLPGAATTGIRSTTVGTYYLSFMAAFGTVEDPNTNAGADLGFRTIEIWPEGGSVGTDGGRFEIGYQGFAGPADQQIARNARLHFASQAGQFPYQYLTETTFNEDNNNTHLIVMKMTMSDQNNGDTIALFLDPTVVDEPIVPSAVAANINFTMSAIATISVFGNPTGIRPVFDELRFGTEYIDVLPELPKPGDTNGDDLVDLVDYQAIISHMNLLGQPLANGDVTGDGKVTIADYRFWKVRRTDLTAGAGGGAIAGVPEPASLLMVLISAAILAGVGSSRMVFGRTSKSTSWGH